MNIFIILLVAIIIGVISAIIKIKLILKRNNHSISDEIIEINRVRELNLIQIKIIEKRLNEINDKLDYLETKNRQALYQNYTTIFYKHSGGYFINLKDSSYKYKACLERNIVNKGKSTTGLLSYSY